MIRSFFVSRTRVVRVAIVSHPSPSTMGSTALPLSPMARNARFIITAKRGR